MRRDEERRGSLTDGTLGLGSRSSKFLQTRHAQHVIALWQQSELAIRLHDLLFAQGAHQVLTLFNLQLQTTRLCVLLVLLRIVGRKARFFAQCTH